MFHYYGVYFSGEGNSSSDGPAEKSDDQSAETIGDSADDEVTAEQDERDIMDLLAQSKWSAAVAAYKAYLTRWPPRQSDPDWHGVGTRTVEDDIHAILNIYCKHLQAKVIDNQLASGTTSI